MIRSLSSFCLALLGSLVTAMEPRIWLDQYHDFVPAVAALGGKSEVLQSEPNATAITTAITKLSTAGGTADGNALLERWGGTIALARKIQELARLDPVYDGPHAAIVTTKLAIFAEQAVEQTLTTLKISSDRQPPHQASDRLTHEQLDNALVMIQFRRELRRQMPLPIDAAPSWESLLVTMSSSTSVQDFLALLTKREAAWWPYCLTPIGPKLPPSATTATTPYIGLNDLVQSLHRQQVCEHVPSGHPLRSILLAAGDLAWQESLARWVGPNGWPPGYPAADIPKRVQPVTICESALNILSDCAGIYGSLNDAHDRLQRAKDELAGSEQWLQTPELAKAWTGLDVVLRKLSTLPLSDRDAWEAIRPELGGARAHWDVEGTIADGNWSLGHAVNRLPESKRPAVKARGEKVLAAFRGSLLREQVNFGRGLPATVPKAAPEQSDTEAIQEADETQSKLVQALDQLDRALASKPR